MNQFATSLREKAAELRASVPELVALGMLKEAGLSEEQARLELAQAAMEKEACAALTYKGIDVEEAAKLVKAANINVKELASFGDLITEEEKQADLLEKAAAEIERLSLELESTKEEVEHTFEMSEPMNKLASVGAFTAEDLEALSSVPQEVLTKVASAVEEPWGFGKAAGIASSEDDPLLAFLKG